MFDSEIISLQPNRLVPENFTINPRAEFRTRMQNPKVEEDYPPIAERLVMTLDEVKLWVDGGMDYHAERKDPSAKHPLGINMLLNHPNYLRGLEKGTAAFDDGEIKFSPDNFKKSLLPEGYRLDSRGVPVHPYYDILLEEGAVIGPGFYWNYGPNPSASAIIFGIHEGKLNVIAIKKRNSEEFLLPGGMVDTGETPLQTALREAREETHFNSEEVDQYLLPARCLASGRTTLNAWEETQAGLYIPKASSISDFVLSPDDDAREAYWIPLNTKTLNGFFLGHANDIRTGIRKYEEEYGKKIASDGTVYDQKA
jgi:8-oxo-dGTP pyrophosphatase MutT (NUDIX family)